MQYLSPSPLADVRSSAPTGPGHAERVPRPAPDVVRVVQASLSAVAAQPVQLADAFYEHLFQMAPALRAMFRADMTLQMQKMTDTLIASVAALRHGDTTETERRLRLLGRHHRDFLAVESPHYTYIGHALTRAVRDVSEAHWSGALSSSWIAITQWICTHMLAGAEEASGVPAPRGIA